MVARSRLGSTWHLLWVLVITTLSAVPSAARAEPSTATPPAAYDRLIEEAIYEYRARHFPEARSLFSQANELFPNARALRGMGMVEFEMRNYVESVQLLRRALASRERPLGGQLKAETESLLARAQSFIAELELDATPMPSTVTVDGTPSALADGRVLMLEVGDHVLEFDAPGYLPQRRLYKVRGGERERVHVVFPKLEEAAPRADAAPPPPPDKTLVSVPESAPPSRKLYKNPWLWTSVGLALAAAGVGLGVGLRGRSVPAAEPIADNPITSLRAP